VNCGPGTCKIDFTVYVCGGHHDSADCCYCHLWVVGYCTAVTCIFTYTLQRLKKITSHCFSEGIVTRFDGHAPAGIYGTRLNKIVVAILTARCGGLPGKVDIRSVNQDISFFYGNRRYILSVHKNPALDPILCQIQSVYSLPVCFFITYFNIILGHAVA
jgi:hypothetical protein